MSYSFDNTLKPEIWAILNLTNDSFYSASRVQESEVIEKVKLMLSQGADKIDIGAESSRPFADSISADEEWARLSRPLQSLSREFGLSFMKEKISVDTVKLEVCKKALDGGVGCINDISGMHNEDIALEVAKYQAEYVLMHTQGNPKTMQIHPTYNDVVQEVLNFLKEKTQRLLSFGFKKSNIIWDVGIGFGKSFAHNWQLVRAIKMFNNSEHRVLWGVSRKSLLGELLNSKNAEDRGSATLALHFWLSSQNADILRVHDVQDTRDVLKVLEVVSKGTMIKEVESKI